MQRNVIVIAAIGVALSMFFACSQNKVPARVSQPSDSLYTEQAALLVYGRNPQRALVIIDSAEIVGNVTSFKADYLRATVYGQSVVEPRHERALRMCDSLLELPEASDETDETIVMRSNVLRLLQGICRTRSDNERWLECSVELAELNRRMGKETEVLRTEADIALAYVLLGREEEGNVMLNRTIAALDNGTPSVDRMDAWIVAVKRKINLLLVKKSYDGIITLAQRILSKLEHYESHASQYAEDSFRLPAVPENRKYYCDFYRAQAYGFLAHAYAELRQSGEARSCLEAFEASDFGQTFSGHRMMADTWVILGEWDKFFAYVAEAEERLGTDTLNSDYATILYGRSEAAKAKGQYHEACNWLNRYATLCDTLNHHFRKSQAQECAARYHEQEQQLALSKKQTESQRLLFLASGLIVVLLLTGVFLVILFRQTKAIRRKNAALSREITELIEMHENELMAYGNETPDNTQEQQAKLSDMNTEELLDQQLMDRFHLSKDRIGAAFSQGSRYDSLKAFLNNVRLQYAAKMLLEHPDMTIADVASLSGFSSGSIFARNFKQHFALTATEFREQKGGETTIHT